MTQPAPNFRGVAVDVGNSAIHVGLFNWSDDAPPQPENVVYLLDGTDSLIVLGNWANLFLPHPVPWHIASVNDRAASELTNWLKKNLPAHPIRHITHRECPIPIHVAHPEKVGVDRFMAVAAAQRICGDGPAIVVDAGTAVTVDLLAAGAFQGGAILPGMRMSAAALDRYTDKLPLVNTGGMDAPDVVGRSTLEAMKSGMYWGTVGAIRELTSRMTEGQSPAPRVFITGGDGPTLAMHLPEAEYVPDMALWGIALTASRESRDA